MNCCTVGRNFGDEVIVHGVNLESICALEKLCLFLMLISVDIYG